MAEEVPESAAEQESALIGGDAAAMALAMAGASRAEADAYLGSQRRLSDDQRHHLHEQLKSLRLTLWEKRLGVLLRIATAFVGFAVAAGLAYLVWNASESSELLIEPFSVPPDLAARGLTGEVVAEKLLDRLVAMQAQTSSQRAPKSYANSWDEKGIKLDIPDTGVSLTELDSFLRRKLGHDIHVAGEIVRTAPGISLTVRASEADSATGPEADLDTLVQRLAESVYRMTQPYRFAVYLAGHDRDAEALPIFRALATAGPPEEKPWGYIGWSNTVADDNGIDANMALLERSTVVAPRFPVTWNNLAQDESRKGWPELAVRDYKKGIVTLKADDGKTLRDDVVPFNLRRFQGQLDLELGDFRDAASQLEDVVGSNYGFRNIAPSLTFADLGIHEIGTARTVIADPDKGSGQAPGFTQFENLWARMAIADATGDSRGVLSEAGGIAALVAQYPGLRFSLPTLTAPIIAKTEARLGKFGDAEAQISGTPANCYPCLIARAEIAVMEGQRGRADWWFARTIADAPSIPFAYADWGQALLARGDADGAIAKFKLASQKGPHFADPLEGWGEALMAQNRSDLALAKFTEAEKYAPNWGRLHLKWGEALAYAGKKPEAQKQFALAAGLDLTAAEKSELARVSGHG